jgi:hypothetical protein
MASIAVSTLADGTATTPCVAAGTNACGGIHELEDDIIVFVGSGDILNFVTLFATASTSPVPPDQDSVSALASADPLIFVDPNFPGASQYSIVLSPGVGNGLASTVPEPGTGVLLAVPVGFFFACRIRKQSS